MPRVRPTRSAPTRRPRPWITRVLIVVVLVELGLLVALRPALRHSIWHQVSLSVIRKQVAYNELYFTKPPNLPSRISVGAPSEFSFAIKRDGGPVRVAYAVTLTDAQGTTRLTRQDVGVSPKAPSVITEEFRVPVSGAFEVGVTLSPHGTRIYFHGQAS